MNDLFNLNTYFRFLGKNKLYTFINVFGLSVSLMFVILIAVYTVQELSTDKFQENADRIYILGNEEYMQTAYPIGARLQERYPEIEKVCPVIPDNKSQSVFVGEAKLSADIILADSTFFEVFSFPLIDQNPKQVLSTPEYAVISRTFARKAFGEKDPLGQTIKIHDNVTVIVNGVMEDIKNSIIPYTDIIARSDHSSQFNSFVTKESFANAGSTNLFILAKKNVNLQAKADDMLAYFKEIFWVYQNGISNRVTLTPLKDAYFSDLKTYHLRHGDYRLVLILASVGVLILVFAVINYINLTVAQTGFRAKEMAIRRLLGSHRKQLFIRLMFETTLLSFVSFLLAVFMALLLAPYASSLLTAKIDIIAAFTPFNMVLSLMVVLILGIVAGLLPAFVISKSKPVEVVKGTFGKRNKMVFSKFFIIFQNAITVMLLAASITMIAQTLHLVNAPLGYDSVNVIDVGTNKFDQREQATQFVNEISQLASVKRVGLGKGTPFANPMNVVINHNEKSVNLSFFEGDTTFFNILGLRILRDNHVGASEGAFLTRQAYAEMEMAEDETKFEFWGRSLVAGMIEDIQVKNITHILKPVVFRLIDTGNNNFGTILIEVQGDPKSAYGQIKDIYERITQVDFDGMFIDDRIEESFATQKRTSQIVTIFAGIALLISFLGLFAMSTYFIRQRYKEIAIRKVHGSTNPEILSRLIRTFLSYVVIAFVIAIPVVWYIMNRWLSDYSYRINLSAWIFIAAGAFCLSVSFISVYWQSRIAANANPVKTLKSE